jgi:glycosyltransferase involved in cell wall biosynthesis
MDLSVLVPSRNEMFLNHTIQDILEHAESDFEIIVVLDGYWPEEAVPDHKRVTTIYHSASIGQRAATNEAARLARGRYVMKCDAHCSFDQGFDVKMLSDMQPGWTMVPLMRNLHVFDWLCRECGHRKYQSPTPDGCEKCGRPVERDIVWRAKPNPKSTAMRFDRDLKFQYWGAYKKRQEGDLVETMSLLGACWMVERERYFELGMCDEGHGSWGQMGTEVACKTWLSGGKLICNKRTWFAHMFRTQGGDFGFPYPLSGKATRRARKYSKRLWRADMPDEMPRCLTKCRAGTRPSTRCRG